MGARGPRPTPTATKQLRGVRRDRINQNEPIPEEADLEIPPEGLKPEAQRVWRSLAPDLKAKGVLTAWDAEAFARFCAATARVAEAEARLQEEGEVILQAVVRQGEVIAERNVLNPWMRVWQTASVEADRLGARFGLTPSDRSQISVKRQTNDAPKGRFLTAAG